MLRKNVKIEKYVGIGTKVGSSEDRGKIVDIFLRVC